MSSTDSRGLKFELRIQDHGLTRTRLFPRRRSGILSHSPRMGLLEDSGYKWCSRSRFKPRSLVITLLV